MKIKTWFILEFKAIIGKIPKNILKMAIFVFLTLIAVLCAKNILQKQEEKEFVIGYVAQEDEVTGLAIDYFTQLDSIEGWCRFQKIENETMGQSMMAKKRLDALLVMPDKMLESILSGENLQPTLYLSNRRSIRHSLFEDLEKSGIRMLQVAQAQIYTAYRLGAGELSDEINRNNLDLVSGREELFYHTKVYAGKGLGGELYFKGAFITVFFLIFPLFFINSFSKKKEQRLFIWKRAGISLEFQIMAQTLLFFLLIFGLGFVVLFRFFESQFLLFSLMALSMGAYMSAVCTIFEEEKYGIVFGFFSGVVQSFAGGCILPDVLLSDNMQSFARFLPIYYWKDALFSIVCKTKLANNTYSMLCLWIIIFIAVQLLFIRIQCINLYHSYSLFRRKPFTGILGNTILKKPVFIILLQKYCMNVKFILALCIPVFFVHTMIQLENRGTTEIMVGIYDESGTWKNVFSDKDGKFTYVFLDDEKQMEQEIYKGNLMCGFWFPKELKEDIKKNEDTWSVKVYEREDAILTKAVEESVYARIFEEVSNEIFYEQIRQFRHIDLEDIDTTGTFEINVKYVNIQQNAFEDVESDQSKISVSILKIVVRSTIILICVLHGLYQILQDKKSRYYNRSKMSIMVYEILISFLICGVTQLLVK